MFNWKTRERILKGENNYEWKNTRRRNQRIWEKIWSDRYRSQDGIFDYSNQFNNHSVVDCFFDHSIYTLITLWTMALCGCDQSEKRTHGARTKGDNFMFKSIKKLSPETTAKFIVAIINLITIVIKFVILLLS